MIKVADDWWPEWMADLANEDPLATDPVVVGAIEKTSRDYERYSQVFS